MYVVVSVMLSSSSLQHFVPVHLNPAASQVALFKLLSAVLLICKVGVSKSVVNFLSGRQ